MNKTIVYSLDQLPMAAGEIIQFIKNFKLIAVYGTLGAGKTTLIKEICRQLGVPDIVNSPTFALVNEYLTSEKKIIYHFDFYRINSVKEAFGLGYEDYFYSGNICFIEWPEKIEELLTGNNLRIFIEEIEFGARKVNIDPLIT